jgi:hypothetical protein
MSILSVWRLQGFSMLAIIRAMVFALLALTVSGCGMGSHGSLLRGVIIEDTFIAPDGTVSVVDDFDPAKTFDDFDAHCVLLWGEEISRRPLPHLKIHRLLLHTAFSDSAGINLCHFQNERRYQALFFRPSFESAFLSTDPSPGTGNLANDRNNLAPILLPHHLSVDPEQIFAGVFCVDIRGVLSQRAYFNHLGQSRYALTITHVYKTWLVPRNEPETHEPPVLRPGHEEEDLQRLEEASARGPGRAIAACQK